MEDVLLLGRLDSGKMEFHPRPLDLAALCRRLVDELASISDGRCPIEFSTSGLPAESCADERLLRHILLNLLSNAVKYSPARTARHVPRRRHGGRDRVYHRGPRHRHPGGGSAGDFRGLPPRIERRSDARHRPRPGDRQTKRRAPRRPPSGSTPARAAAPPSPSPFPRADRDFPT